MKKQKFVILVIFAIALSLMGVPPARTLAATTSVTGGTNGPLCNSGGYFTPASVTVASGDTITFSVPANDPYAGGVQVNGFPQGSFVVPRGGSVTTQAVTGNVSYQGTWPNSLSCIKGSGTVTVQAASSSTGSSSAPSVSNTTTPTAASTAPAPTPTKTTSTSTKNTQSTPTTTSAQPATPPETVVADTITINGDKVTSMADLTVLQSQPMVLSGTTVPNGKITLTIHSNPTTATVQADSSGDWRYTVTGLPSGIHTIYATVTDPVTGKTSPQAKLLSFTVDVNSAASATHPTASLGKRNTFLPMLVAVGAAVLLIMAVIIAIWRKRHKRKLLSSSYVSVVSSTNSVPPEAPQTTTQVPSTINQVESRKEDRL